MLTLPSVSVQNKFGSVARSVGRGELVTVTQYGEPTMMILPFAMAQDALKLFNAQKMILFMDNLPVAQSRASELTLDQLNTLVHEYRE